MSRELHDGGPVDMHHSQEVEHPGVISQWYPDRQRRGRKAGWGAFSQPPGPASGLQILKSIRKSPLWADETKVSWHQTGSRMEGVGPLADATGSWRCMPACFVFTVCQLSTLCLYWKLSRPIKQVLYQHNRCTDDTLKGDSLHNENLPTNWRSKQVSSGFL